MLTYSAAHAQSAPDKLPLHEIQTTVNAKAIIFFVTGDGGWNSFSKNLCSSLSKRGYHIVALDSKSYFWEPKTPDTLARAVTNVIQWYQNKWKINSWILTGYSFGADVASFVPRSLKEHQQSLPDQCIYIAPSASTDFEIRLTDMIGIGNKERKFNVQNEIDGSMVPTCCIISTSDKQKYARHILIKKLGSDHHFDGEVERLAGEIDSAISSR